MDCTDLLPGFSFAENLGIVGSSDTLPSEGTSMLPFADSSNDFASATHVDAGVRANLFDETPHYHSLTAHKVNYQGLQQLRRIITRNDDQLDQ